METLELTGRFGVGCARNASKRNIEKSFQAEDDTDDCPPACTNKVSCVWIICPVICIYRRRTRCPYI